MTNIELRWKVQGETTTKPLTLQYRTLSNAYELYSNELVRDWSQWMDVPFVVVHEVE